jgi:hypothetical protein
LYTHNGHESRKGVNSQKDILRKAARGPHEAVLFFQHHNIFGVGVGDLKQAVEVAFIQRLLHAFSVCLVIQHLLRGEVSYCLIIQRLPRAFVLCLVIQHLLRGFLVGQRPLRAFLLCLDFCSRSFGSDSGGDGF